MRIENNELPESDQDPEIVAFNDAARGDKVSDMTYIHNMLKRHFVRSIPTLNLKDRQRSFSQEQRYVIYMNSNLYHVRSSEILPLFERLGLNLYFPKRNHSSPP